MKFTVESDGFVGSIRSVQVNDHLLDPFSVVRQPMTIGVTLSDNSGDVADDVIWCHRPSAPCHRNTSNCSHTDECDCNDISRRKFCFFCKSLFFRHCLFWLRPFPSESSLLSPSMLQLCRPFTQNKEPTNWWGRHNAAPLKFDSKQSEAAFSTVFFSR